MRVKVCYENERIEEIEEVIREELELEVEHAFIQSDFKFAYDSARGQLNALKILQSINAQSDLILLVIEEDIFVPMLNFCFGLAYGNKAIISTKRLKQSFYGLEDDDFIFKERCKKEAIHEVCHMLGLGHCRNPNCVMFFSNSIADTDRKSYKPCERCRSLLTKKRSQY